MTRKQIRAKITIFRRKAEEHPEGRVIDLPENLPRGLTSEDLETLMRLRLLGRYLNVPSKSSTHRGFIKVYSIDEDGMADFVVAGRRRRRGRQ